jgi:phytoene synthase
VLADGRDPGGAEAAGFAGVGLGIARVLGDLPRHAARGQCYVPRDVLARHGALPEAVAAGLDSPALRAALSELRAHARSRIAQAWSGLGSLDAPARAALLPMSLAEPLLRRMERSRYQPFADDVAPPQWRRQITLWRAARKF